MTLAEEDAYAKVSANTARSDEQKTAKFQSGHTVAKKVLNT